MKYIVITSKSRNDTLYLCNFLKTRNIACSTINTPRVIGSSCTLSIKSNLESLNKILNLIRTGLIVAGLYIFDTQLNLASRLY